MISVKQKSIFHKLLSQPRTVVFLLVLFFSLIFAHSVLAQAPAYETSGTGGLVQCGNDAANPCTVQDIFNVFVIGTNLLIGMVGIIAIISIIWAGFTMVKAAGNQEGITAGKKRLTNSIIGLILVLLAFVIINAILWGTLGIGVFGGDKIFDQSKGGPKGYIDQGGTNPPASTKDPTNTPPVKNTPPPPANTGGMK